MSFPLPGTVEGYTTLSNTGLVNNAGPSTTFVAGLIGMVSAVTSGTFVNMTTSNYNINAAYGDISGNPNANTTEANAAMADLNTFYSNVTALLPSPIAGDLSGQTFTPGKYHADTFTLDGTLTLNGAGRYYIVADTNIEIGLINTATINLTGGATLENVFFIAGSSSTNGAITIGAGQNLESYFISYFPLLVGDGTIITGGLYSLVGHIDLTNNQINPAVVCYAKGTKILTNRGYVAIENLTKDDVVATRGTIHKEDTIYGPSEWKRIVWLGSYTMNTSSQKTKPVCIKAGALGDSTPTEDLYVSPSHGIIMDGRLVLAKELLNGETIVQDYAEPTVTYYHLELDKHSAIVANGVIAESFLDFGDRKLFKTKWFRPV